MKRIGLLIAVPMVILSACAWSPNVSLIPVTQTPTVTIDSKDFINVLGPRSQEKIHAASAIIIGRARVENGNIHWNLLRGFNPVIEGDVKVTESSPEIGVFVIDLSAMRQLAPGDYSLELSSKSGDNGETSAVEKRFFTIIE